MDPLTLALIGGGIGAGKSLLIDQPKADRQNKLTAAMIKYSPWTHYQWDGKTADPTGNFGDNLFAFGGAGLQYGLLNKKAGGPKTDVGTSETGAAEATSSPASTELSDYLYQNRGKTRS